SNLGSWIGSPATRLSYVGGRSPRLRFVFRQRFISTVHCLLLFSFVLLRHAWIGLTMRSSDGRRGDRRWVASDSLWAAYYPSSFAPRRGGQMFLSPPPPPHSHSNRPIAILPFSSHSRTLTRPRSNLLRNPRQLRARQTRRLKLRHESFNNPTTLPIS